MPAKYLFSPQPAGGTPCQTPCGTRYIQEQTAELGGAAVMQMVLGSEKVGLSPVPSQPDLLSHVRNNNLNAEGPPWAIDPKGMLDTLQQKRPSTFPGFFMLHDYSNHADINARIVTTITDYEVAPAVLTDSGKQWVAVVGYTTDANGLQQVWVHDPAPPIGLGSGSRQVVSVAVWNALAYWLGNPVRASSPMWGNKFIAVCDPLPQPEPLPAAEPVLRADGSEIVSPELAIRFALRILEEEGFREHESFAQAVEAGEPAEPTLVRRADARDQFYYLVRFQRDEGDLAAVVVDARFGSFLEAAAFPEPVRLLGISVEDIPELLGKGVPTWPRVEDARERIMAQLLQATGRHDPAGSFLGLRELLDAELTRYRQPSELLTLRREEIFVHPLLVWRVCGTKTTSLLYPSYVVSTPTKTIYVRAADGLISLEGDDDCLPTGWQLLGG